MIKMIQDIHYHCLKVDLWIPITVKQDHDISRGQVDSQTSSPGAEHEDKLGAVWHVETIDLDLSVLVWCLSVQAAIFIVLPQAVVF